MLFCESCFYTDHRLAIANEFKNLHQGGMIVIKYYNLFIESTQYSRAKVADTPSLISKFMKWLWSAIADKLVKHQFSSLVDGYALAQLDKANIKVRS